MIDAGIVQGSAEMAVPVYYGKDRIDIHTDIHEVELPEEMGGGTVWEYHEYQYTPSEYMEYAFNQVTPILYTKNAYIGDTEVVFDDVQDGRMTVYIKSEDGTYPNYTVERTDNIVTVHFEPLENVTEVTLSII